MKCVIFAVILNIVFSSGGSASADDDDDGHSFNVHYFNGNIGFIYSNDDVPLQLNCLSGFA